MSLRALFTFSVISIALFLFIGCGGDDNPASSAGTQTVPDNEFSGEYTISDSSSLAGFLEYTSITGNLVITTDAAQEVVLPNLKTAKSGLRLDNAGTASHRLISVRLPKLASVTNTLLVTDCDSLRILSLPLCKSIGSLAIIGNYSIANIDSLANITTVNPNTVDTLGRIQITANQNLSSIAGLSGITGTLSFLSVTYNPQLVNLAGLGGITGVENSLYIDSNPMLENILGLNNLVSCQGGMTIRNCNSLLALNGLEKLQTVNDAFWIDNLDLIKNLNGLGALTSGDGLYVYNNDSLTNLAGLGNLSSLSSLAISYNNTLSDIGNLTCLNFHLESLRISFCDSLINLTGLDSLSSIGSLSLWQLHNLNNIDALAELDYIYENLNINNCWKLQSVEGLWNLQTLPGSEYVMNQLYISNNVQTGMPGTGLTNDKAWELVAEIGGAVKIKDAITIVDN